jgi:hypothetical protein
MGFTCLLRQHNSILKLKIGYRNINLLFIKCKNVTFDISLQNVLGGFDFKSLLKWP